MAIDRGWPETQEELRIRELEDALRPFATMASRLVNDGDDAYGACAIVMSNREMIAAMTALGFPVPKLKQ